MERWGRPSSSPDCGTMQQRFTTAPTPHLLTRPRFPPLCPSPLPHYLAVSHLSELLSRFLISHFCLIFPGFCFAFCLLFAPSYTFLFHSPHPPPLSPPHRPKEIWFPPLPGLFTIVPVYMADKDHIALSIWRHLSKLLYTWPFTHLHTLNSMETTSILGVRWVCIWVPAIHVCVLGIDQYGFFRADTNY